jgi:hypothetical protein
MTNNDSSDAHGRIAWRVLRRRRRVEQQTPRVRSG